MVICENPRVQNGIELSGLRDSYTYGNSVTLECKTGYFMIGNHYILCEKNGTWVPKVPSCKKSKTLKKITGFTFIFYDSTIRSCLNLEKCCVIKE